MSGRVGRRAFLASLAVLTGCAAPVVRVSEHPPSRDPGRTAGESPAAMPATPVSTVPRAAVGRLERAPARPTARPPLAARPARPDPGSLQRELSTFLRTQEGAYGIAIRDLNGTVSAGHEESDRFPLGSLYKLLLMFEVMRQARMGGFTLEAAIRTIPEYTFPEPDGGIPPATRASVHEALSAMIRVSSNAAALALIELVRPESLMAAPARLGLSSTAIEVEQGPAGPGHYLIDARGCASDVVDLLLRLDRERLVSPEHDRRMIDLMLGQQIADRLPRLIPADVPVAHKTADLDGFSHDAGLVYVPGRPFAVAALAQGPSPMDGKAVVAEVGRLAFAFFSALG